MKKDKSYDRWIETGYDLLASEGLEALQVERLARLVGLNKSGFYHYFGTREGFLKDLMNHHTFKAEGMAEHIKVCADFDPGFIHVMLDHHLVILVHMQLVRSRHNPLLLVGLERANAIVDVYIVPLWATFVGMVDNPDLAGRFFSMVRDMFYARVTAENMRYEYIQAMATEARAIVLDALKMNELDGSV